MDIQELIKDYRAEHNMTLEAFGNIVGVGKNTVRRWENGITSDLKRSNIQKISKLLNISPAVFFDTEENCVSKQGEEEAKLVKKYNLLSKRDKKVVNSLIDYMIENQE